PDARSDDGMAAEDLRHSRFRLAGHDEAMAQTRSGDADHGDCDCSGRDLGPYDRLLRFFDVAGADVAFDGVWTVLRRRRDLLRHCRIDHCHGGTEKGPASGRVSAPAALP